MPYTFYPGAFSYKDPGTGQFKNVDVLEKQKFAGKKWTVIGDSLTTHNTQSSKLYCDYVAEYTGINVHNMGVSGTGYARFQNTNIAFYQRVGNVPQDSDVITIFGSFNDVTYMAESGMQLGTANDTGTTTIAGCINQTLTNLFTAFQLANLGIVTPTPWKERTPTTQSAIEYVNLLKTIAQNWSVPCMDLFYESNLRPWVASFRARAYTKDGNSGVHPDETGHKIIAPRFEAFLSKLLM